MLAVSYFFLAFVWLLRQTALRRHRSLNGAASTSDASGPSRGPFDLASGSWELRAFGPASFMLASSSAGLIVEGVWASYVFSFLTIALLVRVGFGAFKFVSDVIASGEVLRMDLPRTAGGSDVFVDRLCSQLRALPATPPRPGCAPLFGDWLSSPSWCVAPTVAAIREVEQSGGQGVVPHDDEASSQCPGSQWCGIEANPQNTNIELEDELQGKPLLVRGGLDRETTNESSLSRDGDGDAAASGGGVRTAPYAWDKPSAVSLAHPIQVETTLTYESRSRDDLVAGVACLPWIDCAVPAGALRRLEEVTREEVVFRVHPGQLCGELTSGQYAVCFDWGTRWPWRWPLQVGLGAILGVWSVLPMGMNEPFGPVPTMTVHAATFMLVGLFSYVMYVVGPYEHRNDNVAIGSSMVVAMLTIVLRAIGDDGANGVQGLVYLLMVAASVFAFVPCYLTLLAAMGLASATLGRLEAQGLHDRLLPRTVVGWGAPRGRNPAAAAAASAAAANRDNGGAFSGCGVSAGVRTGLEGNAVEVILPGPRPAWAILLPAVTHPRVVQAQLLPPVAGRGGDPEALPPCSASGDRARLPVPPRLLFPPRRGAERAHGNDDALGLEQRTASTAPLAALLAPGRPGRLVYAEVERNEGNVDWRELVRTFFGSGGTLLADEAERLIEAHASPPGAGADSAAGAGERALVVIEVLPALAAEFMDEQYAPPSERR
eukprot:TRINITY_DN35018_c0_g1_i1.p1 TRINITY_DN35018_c0_g1~~TRINITY_DN35018_c0_g1_i1.p1  ORF type:complete len:772 (+),score=145.04 TRINITY_DN35018_c0_g1_i1:172-2316(+)